MKLIEIRMTKTTIFIYENELVSLLSKDTVLWQKVTERGKSILRERQNQARNNKG